MKQITSVAEMIAEMGGQTATARKLGIKQPQVHRWKKVGIVAPKYFLAVGEILRGKGLSVSPEMFGMRKITLEAEES